MAIPDYQSIMLPLLKLASDKKVHSLRGAIETLADQFELSAEEREALLPSGRQATFDNRVGWARTYLKKAGAPTGRGASEAAFQRRPLERENEKQTYKARPHDQNI